MVVSISPGLLPILTYLMAIVVEYSFKTMASSVRLECQLFKSYFSTKFGDISPCLHRVVTVFQKLCTITLEQPKFSVTAVNVSFYFQACVTLFNHFCLIDYYYYVKSVHIRSYSGPHFPAFELNTERDMAQMPENADQNNSEYGKFLRIVFIHTFENPVSNGN